MISWPIKTLKYLTISNFQKMAKSSFEYVKTFEVDDTLLPNTWIVIRIDGKCFHKFSDDHNFSKPNDLRGLNLMNYAAFTVFREFNDLLLAFGQSDEYSFVFKKHSTLYKRRASKLLTTVNSKFSSSYVFYWNKFFGEQKLKYPPTFDGRVILYPSDENLVDYMKWRQADVHINNLYNTTFWNLVLQGNLTPSQAEKRLCGTVSADKNEILFNEFKINYNSEPEMFKRGTLLMRKTMSDEIMGKSINLIVDTHDDMLKDRFWKENSLLFVKSPKQGLPYEGPITEMIKEQLDAKKNSIQECTKS
ncbi:probable tRNA(His) guanylyltransferase [Ostrinia nubilalis]|uniref:probable tRNA(His) guanylyltransferase n=1 Tax=Ostrinia nubilalis TaxID=29057 RepID=UPI0030823DDF